MTTRYYRFADLDVGCAVSGKRLECAMTMARTTLLLMCMMMGALALADSPSLDSIAGKAAAASAAYEAKFWTKAEPLYEQLVQAQPDRGRNWYRLGVCLQGMGKHQRALDAFQKARAKGMPVSIVGYNISAVYASMGQTDRAIGQLTEAVKQGYAQVDQMSTDPDLQSIRGDASFASLVEQAKHNQSPCDYKPENRQFDFWVGDWDVVTTNEDSRQESVTLNGPLAIASFGRTGPHAAMPAMPGRATTSITRTLTAGNNSGWTTRVE